MRRAGGWATRTRVGSAVIGVAVVVLGAATGNGVASAAPAGTAAAGDPLVATNLAGPGDVDHRTGSMAPTTGQAAAAARMAAKVSWNRFGTPAALGPGTLATGLSTDAVTAAKQYLTRNTALFGLDAKAVDGLTTLAVSPLGAGSVVLLQQRFGTLPAGRDGLVAIAVTGGKVVRVTSTLSRSTAAPAPATLTAAQARTAALADVKIPAGKATSTVRAVAVPTPQGPRAAYEVDLVAPDPDRPQAYQTYVDGVTGAVLVREDQVDFDSDNPKWAVFPASPPPANTASGVDSRVTWCLTPTAGCAKAVSDPVTGGAWDLNVATGQPTFTTQGNSSNDVLSLGNGTPQTNATPRPDRNYNQYPFTDQWHVARCNPATFTSPQRNDADAATANLFAMHNRMHDFAAQLGFTEAAWNLQQVNVSGDGLGVDAEQGRAQSNALGGSRNNANQGTPRDGLPPTTNMFLWQPQAGAAYPPCVDGDYDMTVIGHEYTHAITNRMIAGPDAGISGFQGGSMGESWGDLDATEYLLENGFRAPGNTAFVEGGYVTGNLDRGIRDYDISKNPLNYSDLGFDLVGPEVHADGEIWSATNFKVRQAFVNRYGSGTPSLQLSCAEGRTNVASCPGNRRWIQLMFDSFLLQSASSVSMLDMRDNMLAADLVRFGGANQDIIWNAFSAAGMGQDASTNTANDTDATPSFASPFANNATVTLLPTGDSAGAAIRLYVGDYEARSVPIADTDPETAIPDTFQIVPGQQFTFVAAGPGFGARRFTTQFIGGRTSTLPLNLPRNLASTASGATVTGDGVNLSAIADDTEATDWASLDGVAGKQVTIDLAGTAAQTVSSLNVSALLRPDIGDAADPGTQNRFSALRSFQILACNAAVADCSTDAGFTPVFTSPANAFPAEAFRPVAPDLNLRQFSIPPTKATALRLRVLNSQCTGNPLYAGEQDADPAAATDCSANSTFRTQVRVAEFQAFSR
ncbi:MAG TPA: M36 family metallopeptidase [Mycobacteriales bacterium]|nr:M36 family metallopeptidase [Mycobacteriales bacterium]